MSRYLTHTSDPMPGYDAEGYEIDHESDEQQDRRRRRSIHRYRTPSLRPEPDDEPCDFFDPYEADYAADREAGDLP